MTLNVDITDSLICFINKPGSDSICCQGNISVDLLSENIKKIKQNYEDLVFDPGQPSENNSAGGHSTNDSSDQTVEAQIGPIWSRQIIVSNFTPFICKLEQLDGLQAF